MRVKTNELTGVALDWVVAKCEGRKVVFNHQYTEETKFDGWWQLGPNHWQPLNKYSTDWAHGGPIIEREGVMIERWASTGHWQAANALVTKVFTAETPLVAAMRCYVASKLGDEVELPEELKWEESKAC